MLRTAAHQFAQEDDLAVHLTHGDVVVTDALEGLLHLVQLVIVRREERLGMSAVLMDILDNRPGDRDTVVGAGAAA